MMFPAPVRRLTAFALVALTAAACQPEGAQDVANIQVSVQGSTVYVAGWAWDPDVPTTPIDVHVYVDGSGIATHADGYRPDVATAKPEAGAHHGYSVAINVAPGSHQVCSYGINYPGTAGSNQLLGCREVTVPRATTTTTTAAPATTTTTTPVTSVQSWQDELLAIMNQARAAAQVPGLTRCAALDQSAQAYADQMAANQWLDPLGPDGSQPWDRVSAYGGTSTGENLAWGFDTVTAFHDSTMASDSQRVNVLRAEFTHVGFGRTTGDPDGTGPLPASSYWVQELGQNGTC